MKIRSTKILALMLSAAMVAAPAASVYLPAVTVAAADDATQQSESTELELVNKVNMFLPTKAVLDGNNLILTMDTTSYDEAVVADSKPANNADAGSTFDSGSMTFTINVAGHTDGNDFKMYFRSARQKQWYERDVVILSNYGNEGTNKIVFTENETMDITKAQACANLIDEIYTKTWHEDTDEKCQQAKAAWDALNDGEKELVYSVNPDAEYGKASPEYFGRDTGDASQDNPLNQDNIGDNEILVTSFGTSFNESRAQDIGGVEKALQAAFPNWSVRRAFSSQVIINHIYARDGEKIDNLTQAFDRAVANGVKNIVIQPTQLMHGTEYDSVKTAADKYAGQINIRIAEPLLGEVGATTTDVNLDKADVAKAVVAEVVKAAGFNSAKALGDHGTAIVLMGHGTSHNANITYDQMQAMMNDLGYDNVFVGTVEGDPEDTACDVVIGKVKAAGYTKVILHDLMVVAGDHANNDMGGADDSESWINQFKAAGFDDTTTQLTGLGRIADVESVFVRHARAVIGFDDVASDKYYANAISWAITNGITSGVGDNTFVPAGATTRAQFVSFLYRLAGSPAVDASASKFTDVAADADYASAVAWAVANNIVTGATATTFDPNGSLTRAQAVTLIYRYEGSPAASGATAFTDVKAGSFYADAVAWAVANKVTTGATATTFNPNKSCGRAQAVTLLYNLTNNQ